MVDTYQEVTNLLFFSCQLMALSSTLLPKPAISVIHKSSWLSFCIELLMQSKCLSFSPALALVDTLHHAASTMVTSLLLVAVSDLLLLPLPPLSMCQGLTVHYGLMVPPFVLNCGTQSILLILALIQYTLGCSLTCRLYVF